jgi:uncharacterized protein YceK
MALVIVLSLLPGCATIGDVADTGGRVFGGVRFAVEYTFNIDGPWKKGSGWKLRMFIGILLPILFLDFPLSLLADTVLLPYTIIKAATGL